MSAIGYLENGYILNNKYRIIRKLGEGGFYITYLAEELTLHYQVVIKELVATENHATRSQMNNSILPYEDKINEFNYLMKKFREEAKLLIRLKHPNILRVLELIEANNTIYMVMEYEEGEDLKSYLAKYPEINENEIINIMNSVFEAIKYVHSKGILHNGIYPDNIYIQKNGISIVTGFYLARSFMNKNINIDFALFIIDGYSPLEQYSRATQSPPTDIYALGAVLYRMMSGKRPVSSHARQHTLYSGAKDPLENLNRICKNKYSKNLIDVVNKAMNLKREDRFQTIDEMQRALFSKSTWINIKGIRF